MSDEEDRDDKWITEIELNEMNSWIVMEEPQERRDMIQIASFNFYIDDGKYINILMEDAKRLYNDLTKYYIFGLKNGGRTGDNDPVKMIDIFCEVKLGDRQFDVTIHQLKELYYVLHDMFEKTTNTR